MAKENKKTKSLYMKESTIRKLEKLSERHSIHQNKIAEIAIDRIWEEGLNIPKIRFGKQGINKT